MQRCMFVSSHTQPLVVLFNPEVCCLLPVPILNIPEAAHQWPACVRVGVFACLCVQMSISDVICHADRQPAVGLITAGQPNA